MSEPIVQSAVDSTLVAPSTGGEPDISALAVALDRELVHQIGLLPASRWPWGVPWEVRIQVLCCLGSLIALWRLFSALRVDAIAWQGNRNSRMATCFQVRPEKRRGGAIQRADAAKVPHRQSLQADNKLCDVARGIRDVVKVPINHHRPSTKPCSG